METLNFTSRENFELSDTFIVDVGKSKIVDLSKMIDEANSCPVGRNIYFVRMNASDMKNKIAGTSHELRPFVVVGKTYDYKLKGFYTTSNLKGLNFSKKCFTKYRTVLSNKKYKLNKSSVVIIDKMFFLDDFNILKKIDLIDNRDLANIFKMNALFNGRKVELNGKYLGEGDVVQKTESNYLIYQKDSLFSYGIKIKYKEKMNESRIDLRTTFDYFVDGDEIYRIFYNDYIKVSNDDRVVLRDHLADDILRNVKLNKKNKRYHEKSINKKRVKCKRNKLT